MLGSRTQDGIFRFSFCIRKQAEISLFTILTKLKRALSRSGLADSVNAFYFDDPSSSPVEVDLKFFVKMFFETTKIKKKMRPGLAHI